MLVLNITSQHVGTIDPCETNSATHLLNRALRNHAWGITSMQRGFAEMRQTVCALITATTTR